MNILEGRRGLRLSNILEDGANLTDIKYIIDPKRVSIYGEREHNRIEFGL
jgi:hypothetical protein